MLAGPGVGICRNVGVPESWLEGTGDDASRAVEAARGAELPYRDEPGDVPAATSSGLEAEGSIVIIYVTANKFVVNLE
jgi:hypothetical protein